MCWKQNRWKYLSSYTQYTLFLVNANSCIIYKLSIRKIESLSLTYLSKNNQNVEFIYKFKIIKVIFFYLHIFRKQFSDRLFTILKSTISKCKDCHFVFIKGTMISWLLLKQSFPSLKIRSELTSNGKTVLIKKLSFLERGLWVSVENWESWVSIKQP